MIEKPIIVNSLKNGEPVGGDDDLDTRSEVSSSTGVTRSSRATHPLSSDTSSSHSPSASEKEDEGDDESRGHKRKRRKNPSPHNNKGELWLVIILVLKYILSDLQINCPNVPKKSQKENLGNMVIFKERFK